MKTNRRRFIKVSGVTVTGMMATDLAGMSTIQKNKQSGPFADTKKISEEEHKPLFNMCRYSAPKLDTVRVGFIGLGNRGPVNLDTMAYLEGVEIKALCDKRGGPCMPEWLSAQWRTVSMWQLNLSIHVYTISGTKGICQKYPLPGRISQGKDDWFTEQEMDELTKKYTPEIVNRMGELAKEIGGHGGMDFLMNWRLIDCLRNGLAPEQDVYDAATWSSVVPLSEWSVANDSNSIRIPDFTCGSYKTNLPLDITLSKGGNTGVRKHM
jgi:hypothetical protein